MFSGFVFLLPAVICITGTALFSRMGMARGATSRGLALALFTTSTAIGWVGATLRGLLFAPIVPAVACYGVLAGVCGAAAVVLFNEALERGHFAYSNAIYRCSFIIPIVFCVAAGSLVPDWHTVAALVGVIVGVILMSKAGSERECGARPSSSNKFFDRQWMLLIVAAFLASGGPRVAQMRVAALQGDSEVYLRVSFLAGTIVLGAYFWATRRRVSSSRDARSAEWRWGSLAAVTSFSGVATTLQALTTLPPQIVFPVSLCTPIMLGLLLGLFVFCERIRPAGWLGIGVTLCGLTWLAIQ